MTVRVSWTTGFDVSPKFAGSLPIVSLLAVLAGFATWGDENTDFRLTPFPWLLTIALWCLVGCCLGILSLHRGESRLVIFGGWWTALAFLGLSAFPAAIAVGGVIGMTAEDAPDWLVLPPFLATTFGLLTMTPAMAIMAWGSMRASVLPKYASAIMFVAAVLLPLSMFLGGNVFGEIGFTGTVTLFGVAWIVIGIIITRTNKPQLSRP